MGPTPRELGFRMPAEWEKHCAVWLAWPYDTISFPDLEKTENVYIEFIKILSSSEKVNLLVLGDAMMRKVQSLFKSERGSGSIIFHQLDYADVWFRDYGPIFVLNSAARKIAAVKWKFNAWGNKYEELLKDNLVFSELNKKLNLTTFETGIVLEGGAIDVNGCGTALTTRQCLLNPNRNKNMSQDVMESYLKNYLGIDHTIWLSAGIAGDDTDGHVDDVARFVGPKTVLCAYSSDKKNRDYKALRENYDILVNSADQAGESLNIIKLPTPNFHKNLTTSFPASYTNFYISNSIVIVPTFDSLHDREAVHIIQSVFPNKKVMGLDARGLVGGCGTFHCITQQQPLCGEEGC